MSYLRGIALLLLVSWPVLTFPQDTPKTNDETADATKPRDYVGSTYKRFLLGWQYQYQRVEQPDFVLVTQPGNTQLLLPNPESHLNQHSFIYDFSQVFLTPAQLAHARKLNSKLFCDENDPLACVARAGEGPKRFLSGLTITANIAEHPVVAQGAILPAGYLYGGQVDFKPANLFTTGTDWKTSTSYIDDKDDWGKDKDALVDNLDESKGCKVPLPDPKNPVADRINNVNCAKGLLAYHGLTHKQKFEAFLSFITPTFQYKRLTPFDFLKYGGTLVPSSNSHGLNSWSITVDARRLIASPTSRLDAIDAAKTIRPNHPPNDPITAVPVVSSSTKLCGLIFKGGSLSIVSVPYETSKESCLETAKAIHAEQYELGCSGGKDTVLGTPEKVEPPVRTSLPTPNRCGWEP